MTEYVYLLYKEDEIASRPDTLIGVYRTPEGAHKEVNTLTFNTRRAYEKEYGHQVFVIKTDGNRTAVEFADPAVPYGTIEAYHIDKHELKD